MGTCCCPVRGPPWVSLSAAGGGSEAPGNPAAGALSDLGKKHNGSCADLPTCCHPAPGSVRAVGSRSGVPPAGKGVGGWRGHRSGARAVRSQPAVPGRERLGRDEAMGLPLGTPPAWWPTQGMRGTAKAGKGGWESPPTASDLGAAAAFKLQQSRVGSGVAVPWHPHSPP